MVEVLDLSNREPAAELLDRSLKSAGVAMVKMTERQARVIRMAQHASRQFFALPCAEKERVRAPTGAGNACLRGWVGYGSKLQRSADIATDTAPAGAGRAPDRKESFTAGEHLYSDPETRHVVDHSDAEYFEKEAADGRFFAVNRWPEGPVGVEVRSTWREYMAVMEELAQEIYELMARILDIDPAIFRNSHPRHFSEVRCNHYLATAPTESAGTIPLLVPGQRRISPHRDFTDFSILAPDDHAPFPHLKLAARDGDLAGGTIMPYHGDCVTILLGLPMQRRSNDRWFAPLHCVEVPTDPLQGCARLTLVFFRNPDYSTLITTAPSQGDSKYADITVGEHWWGMYDASTAAFGVEFTEEAADTTAINVNRRAR